MSTDETMIATPLDRMPAWRAVMAHHAAIRDRHLRQLFADDPGRAERLTAEGAGLFLDYSKHRVTDETMPRAPACSWTTASTGSRTRR
jgi:glucose-6-phosphate isomerase